MRSDYLWGHTGGGSLKHTNQQTSGPINCNKILEIIYTDKNLCHRITLTFSFHHVLLKITHRRHNCRPCFCFFLTCWWRYVRLAYRLHKVTLALWQGDTLHMQNCNPLSEKQKHVILEILNISNLCRFSQGQSTYPQYYQATITQPDKNVMQSLWWIASQ